MIQLENLQKVIEKKTVIDIDSLSVAPGEIAALVGLVDSGKEALFDLMTGRSRPTMGEVRLAGIDPFEDRALFSRQVGVLFAEDTVYKRQTALGNLRFDCRLRRLPKSRASEVLAQVGLADQANTRAEDLPSSLLRRLAFGRAILHQPGILLLAEPFARCDDSSISLLTRAIQQLAGDDAAILIFAEDVAHLASLGDMVYRLEKGRIVQAFDPQEQQRPDLPFVIPARLEGKVALVDPVDIWYVFAQDDRTFLQTAEGALPTQFTLAELEKRLARSGFFRTHRSYLVNLQRVREVSPYTRDTFSLKLKDDAGTEIPLSKSAARELRELLGY